MVVDALHEPLRRLLRAPAFAAADVQDDLLTALDRLDRVSARARNLSDLVTTAVDVTLARVGLQQNEDMRRISAWVAIAAVPTLLAGIYGMTSTPCRSCDGASATRWRSPHGRGRLGVCTAPSGGQAG